MIMNDTNEEIMKNPHYVENKIDNTPHFVVKWMQWGNDPRNLITRSERKKKLDVTSIERERAITERRGFRYDLP